jgi:uncharacterized protein (DUF885 family)
VKNPSIFAIIYNAILLFHFKIVMALTEFWLKYIQGINVKKIILFTLASCFLMACEPKNESKTQSVAVEKETVTADFDQVITSITQDWLRSSPESASSLGVSEDFAGGSYLARLGLTGLAGRDETMKLVRSFVDRLENLKNTSLTEQQQQMVEIQLFRYRQLLTIADLVDYGTPYLSAYGPGFEPYAVAQMNGPHVEFSSLMQNDHPVTNSAQAQAFIARLLASSDMLAGLEEEVLADAKKGVIPPDFIIEKTVSMLRNMIGSSPRDNGIYTSFVTRLEQNNIENSETLNAQALSALTEHTYKGYNKLANTLESLTDQANNQASLQSLPNGKALYAAMILLNTDTTMSADVIHQLGLDNVARIHGEMNEILNSVGRTQGSVSERLNAMSKDPALVYPDTEAFKNQTIEEVRAMVTAIEKIAPQYFGTLPKSALEVRRVPAFREKTSAAGYYNAPSEDGTRPGIYYINLRSTSLVPTYALPTLSYHEAVPGHHFQVALGLEQKGLPILQRVNTNTNAFAEGWALYSERLAWEMNMYEDKPLADIGRLIDELHRAVRLVVDTGMHAKGWSREQAVEYMATTKGADATGMGSEVVSEIERYIVMPGQALGYMIGMIKILDLRHEAQEQLGDNYDIRSFHDAVLIKGGMPLLILEKDVRNTLGLKAK